MDYESLKFYNYKLFNEVELRGLKRVNVIIGKNNSGKSSLIDVIGASYDANYNKSIGDSVGDIIAEVSVTKQMISNLFSRYQRIEKWSLQSYTNAAENHAICFSLYAKNGSPRSTFSVDFDDGSDEVISELKGYWSAQNFGGIVSAVNNYCFRRMRAERDIIPESASNEKGLAENGEGASNLIRKVMLESSYDEQIIENKLLSELNSIMYPDSIFDAIRILQTDKSDGGIWEIFLQEKGNIRIPLSKMGSGLKTIILILLNLLVFPRVLMKIDPTYYSRKKFVFAFEEIENNLHPALQRRIFEYLYNYAEKNDVTLFITTHSHVAINCFFSKEHASIYHIEKNNGIAEVKRIETYLDKVKILSDLDVRASDLLQSNGIIWVEGPSDRIYIKRWFDLFTDNRFVEGQHFQFMYYGGRNLANFSADEQTKLVSILTTNRNAVIVIDSDKRSRNSSINDTKKRIRDEFNRLDMFCWVTSGKEIENYIPVEAIKKLVGKSTLKQCSQFELFPDYIKRYYSGFDSKKVQFANSVTQFMEEDDCRRIMDVHKCIRKMYGFIEKWNK